MYFLLIVAYNCDKLLRGFSQSNSYKTTSPEKVSGAHWTAIKEQASKGQEDYKEVLLVQTEILPGLQDKVMYHCMFISGMFLHHELGQKFKFTMKSKLC